MDLSSGMKGSQTDQYLLEDEGDYLFGNSFNILEDEIGETAFVHVFDEHEQQAFVVVGKIVVDYVIGPA